MVSTKFVKYACWLALSLVISYGVLAGATIILTQAKLLTNLKMYDASWNLLFIALAFALFMVFTRHMGKSKGKA